MLGGLAVVTVEDLSHPVDGLPPTTGLRLWLGGVPRDAAGPTTGPSAWVVVRPSGTERTTKCYLEVGHGPGRGAGRSHRGVGAVTADVRAVLTEAS